MGKQIDSKNLTNGKVKCTILMDLNETLHLKGNLMEVYLFSPDSCEAKAGVFDTGIKHSTKYFEIPESMALKHTKKRKIKTDFSVSCQKIEKEDKAFFIYVVSKK
ncbi:MAG: hypothetical protein GY861_12300 [bacterium]|nr:hypothetical protein [bacterium]